MQFALWLQVLHVLLSGVAASGWGLWTRHLATLESGYGRHSSTGPRNAAAQVTHVLVSGVAASRWGLWTFDLAVSQMLQERVRDADLSAPLLASCNSFQSVRQRLH